MFLQISGGKKKNVNGFAQKMSKYCLQYPSRELFPYVYKEFILEIKSLCPFGWMKVPSGTLLVVKRTFLEKNTDTVMNNLHVVHYVPAFTFEAQSFPKA